MVASSLEDRPTVAWEHDLDVELAQPSEGPYHLLQAPGLAIECTIVSVWKDGVPGEEDLLLPGVEAHPALGVPRSPYYLEGPELRWNGVSVLNPDEVGAEVGGDVLGVKAVNVYLWIGPLEDDEGPHRVVVVGVGQDDSFDFVRCNPELIQLWLYGVCLVADACVDDDHIITADDIYITAQALADDE